MKSPHSYEVLQRTALAVCLGRSGVHMAGGNVNVEVTPGPCWGHFIRTSPVVALALRRMSCGSYREFCLDTADPVFLAVRGLGHDKYSDLQIVRQFQSKCVQRSWASVRGAASTAEIPFLAFIAGPRDHPPTSCCPRPARFRSPYSVV